MEIGREEERKEEWWWWQKEEAAADVVRVIKVEPAPGKGPGNLQVDAVGFLCGSFVPIQAAKLQFCYHFLVKISRNLMPKMF